ncbi:hypothetical protein [Cupriavidus sp. UGS-1]|uniref:hypothetical protein n=1 Tax=Cupriavidus sp. UGS-1 TaxID=2899826 RepID=UPI001E402056|nr:hypothetical protein [Cupriavidus sp. UGS-1]MCD9121037.1 hypothetical protein [Cupriavidus sp. UGS-1]
MPFVNLPDDGDRYALIAFDEDGDERADDPDGEAGCLSLRLLERWRAAPPTDVFLWCHGWKGDMPAALDQYGRWIGAFARQRADREAAQAQRPELRIEHVGLHWPSQPWGDEEMAEGAGDASFAAAAAVGPQALIDAYAERLGDTPRVRAALATIVEVARTEPDAMRLPVEAQAAYRDLDWALGLRSEGIGGDLSSDRLPFDPEQAFDDALQVDAAFGGPSLSGILAPLRQLSFWTMKKRGQRIGETALHPLLNRLLEAAPAVRLHLVGHSFGCVVMSSALAGPGGDAPLRRPVASCVLIQGAMSIWSYSPDIPLQPGTAGYCHGILTHGKVSGPIVVTRSRHDSAVGVLYPWAAGVASQLTLAETSALPKYGAIGAFGLQGIDGAADASMLGVDGVYPWGEGDVFNLDASQFIRKGQGISGAHSDIDGPEVAHLIWQAAMAAIAANGNTP